MLIARAADGTPVVQRALVSVSTLCCVLVLISFALFTAGQLAGASQHQQNELASNGVVGAPAPANPRQHGQPRRFIDDAANALTSPFHSVVQSSNPWVEQGIPTVLALAVYGLGLGYLARFSRGFA
jgi:hypothetical protein